MTNTPVPDIYVREPKDISSLLFLTHGQDFSSLTLADFRFKSDRMHEYTEIRHPRLRIASLLAEGFVHESSTS